jgi:CheY-like chemotaxis protein
MATPSLTPILCVDDEPLVLEGLALTLRRRYAVTTATSGAQGLACLAAQPATAVVLSDMRMPGMDGVAFLRQARQQAPDAVRLLLTGQADLEASIAAINEGQVFRFLSKPCPPPAMLAAVDAAAEQHRLVTAEKVLLEQTLHGSIQMLIELLTLTSPAVFGRATRLKQRVNALAERLKLEDRWQVEVAAMLSQLGYVTLPPEQAMVARLPEVTEQLLGHIPRLEGVRAILAGAAWPARPLDPRLTGALRATVERGVQLLSLALDADGLEARGQPPDLVLATLRARVGRHDPTVLAALAALLGDTPLVVRELALTGLISGMVFAEDVKLINGTLLVARGFEVTPSFLERMRNIRPGTVQVPLRVLVRRAA